MIFFIVSPRSLLVLRLRKAQGFINVKKENFLGNSRIFVISLVGKITLIEVCERSLFLFVSQPLICRYTGNF